MAKAAKIEYFESLRGIAALAIVLLHANFIYDSPVVDVMEASSAFLMVDFFFVLSGWVIALNYSDRLSTVADVVRFQTKRLLRLYPLHLLTLLAFVAVEVGKNTVRAQGWVADGAVYEVSFNDVPNFLLNLFMVHVPFADNLSWNYPSWSISAEVITYLVFALLVLFGGARKYWLIGAAMALSFFALLPHAADFDLTIGMDALYRCIMAFMLGVLVQKLSQMATVTLPNWSDYLAAIIIALGFVFQAAVPDILFPFLFAAALLAFSLSGQTRFKTVLERPSFVFLGTISYGIYMWHALVWLVMPPVLIILFDPTVHYGNYSKELLDFGLWGGLLVQAVGVGIVVILSYLSYRFVEMPANRLRRHIGQPKATPASNPA